MAEVNEVNCSAVLQLVLEEPVEEEGSAEERRVRTLQRFVKKFEHAHHDVLIGEPRAHVWQALLKSAPRRNIRMMTKCSLLSQHVRLSVQSFKQLFKFTSKIAR